MRVPKASDPRRREWLRQQRAAGRAYAKQKPVLSEIENAWILLSDQQRDQVRAGWERGESVSPLSCRLQLTRSAVHSYVRRLNRGES